MIWPGLSARPVVGPAGPFFPLRQPVQAQEAGCKLPTTDTELQTPLQYLQPSQSARKQEHLPTIMVTSPGRCRAAPAPACGPLTPCIRWKVAFSASHAVTAPATAAAAAPPPDQNGNQRTGATTDPYIHTQAAPVLLDASLGTAPAAWPGAVQAHPAAAATAPVPDAGASVCWQLQPTKADTSAADGLRLPVLPGGLLGVAAAAATAAVWAAALWAAANLQGLSVGLSLGLASL